MNDYRRYRAKRKDTGEWVYGFYVCAGNDCHYILSGKLELDANRFVFEKYSVISTTVCQSIGMTDINNNEIFEDDIIKRWCNGKLDTYIVKYDTSTASYIGMSINNKDYINFNVTSSINYSGDFEKVGNVYDDSELFVVINA